MRRVTDGLQEIFDAGVSACGAGDLDAAEPLNEIADGVFFGLLGSREAKFKAEIIVIVQDGIWP